MATEGLVAPAKGNLVTDLLRSSAWVERPRKVDLRETHISWVFLTDRFAYKVKKPVALGFLDFSTSEKRRQACLDEVRLNRRLAADTYLGVVPITRSSNGRFRVGGMGAPLDWAVKMHRLPDDRSLAHLIVKHQLDEAELQRLVNRLVCFYSSLPPLSMPAEQYRADIERHIRENRLELIDPRHALPHDRLERIHSAQRRFLHLAADLIDSRVCDGRVVEGHGDLRPDHIYLAGEPVIIDCVEFSREFRCLDVLDEISFLAMECAMLGAASIGRRIVTQFCTISGDRPVARLLAFYQSYRACVRAKVMALRAQQLEEADRDRAQNVAINYLSIADEFASQLGPPILVVVSGAAGTGKSTVAQGLTERLELTHLQTDAIRREIFGEPANDDRYATEHREEVYREMFRRAEAILSTRRSVVVDGTFLRASQLEEARRIAAREGARLLVVRCHCPEEVAHERIRARGEKGKSLSEANVQVHCQQARDAEPISSQLPQCQIDSTCIWPEIWEELKSHLRRELLELGPTAVSTSGAL